MRDWWTCGNSHSSGQEEKAWHLDVHLRLPQCMWLPPADQQARPQKLSCLREAPLAVERAAAWAFALQAARTYAFNLVGTFRVDELMCSSSSCEGASFNLFNDGLKYLRLGACLMPVGIFLRSSVSSSVGLEVYSRNLSHLIYILWQSCRQIVHEQMVTLRRFSCLPTSWCILERPWASTS